jgi:hypothetical protein
MAGEAILQKAAITIPMRPTTFGTGSDGFRGVGKVIDGEARYQVQIMAIRIGSKPSGNGHKPRKH